MLLVRLIVVVLAEQIVEEDGEAVTEGAGLTVTVAVIGEPAHELAVGVMVYTAVPAEVVVAVSVCAIVDPEEADAPVTFVCVAVQLKVVPVTLLVRETVVVLFEQIDCEFGVAVADGIGLTVTVTVTTAPEQLLAVGVIV